MLEFFDAVGGRRIAMGVADNNAPYVGSLIRQAGMDSIWTFSKNKALRWHLKCPPQRGNSLGGWAGGSYLPGKPG